MKKLGKHLIALLMRIAFWFRYRIKVVGLEKLTPEALKKKGGVLFLPNHPTVFVDPTMITMVTWPKFPIRPIIVEYQYYIPFVNRMMRFLDALAIPNFNVSSNSLKRKKAEKVIETVIQDLQAGNNFLIYPAGKTKSTSLEVVGGASAVHHILSKATDANVVLVRIKGLWGSSFSRSLTGFAPAMFPTIWHGVKHVLKNLLFFTPRRQVIIEFEPAPADFPHAASRLELNKYLEKWYNQPDGLSLQQGELPGDSLIQVSYSCWGNVIPKIEERKPTGDENVKVEKIPQDIQKQVIQKIAEITEYDPASISPQMNLAVDLGLDSLDISEIAIFLEDTYGITGLPYTELTTVGKVMAIASKQVVCREEQASEEVQHIQSKWKKSRGPKKRLHVPPGKIMPEVFLNNCDKYANDPASVDIRTGILTYKQLKMRALLLANYIRQLPGEYIGILLPSSAAAQLLIMAVQLAGKVPLMINWTVGPRHLETVKKLSNVQSILTSWAFIDKLENVDFNGIEDQMIMLEDLRHRFSYLDKLKAFWLARKNTRQILNALKLDQVSEDSAAVLLFTSGSESMPKGVPLSHKNVLTSQRGVLNELEIFNDDVLLSILPPFHSFGFSITNLLCAVGGVKTAYSPDPKDGPKLVREIERYGVTIMGGTPTFIKAIMKAAKPDQFRSVRFCFTGAEKAQSELFQLMTQFGKKESFLLEGYGITECSPVLTFNRLTESHKGVGRAAPEVELCVVHPETLQLLSIGEQGLILARGPNVFAGYLNLDVASPFVEVEGKKWYKTGDLGYLDQKGFLNLSGRLKRFIKVGGEMFSLASIEDALLQQGLKKGWPVMEEGVPLAICAKEIPGDKPKIYLFTRFDLNLEEANQAVKEAGFSNLVRLSGFMRLREIPIMGTGKTNYRVLESEYVPKIDEKK